jgi:hypothetical protein
LNLILLIFNLTLPGVNQQGDRIFYFDARSLALGGVSDVLENGDNPAAIGMARDLMFFTTAEMITGNERRGLRVYDSYGNNIGISTISNNTFSDVTFSTSSIIFPLIEFLHVGIKYYPLWDFYYFYHYDYRDDFYQITKIVEDNYNGNVYSFAPVIAFHYKFLNVGIQENFFFGKKTEEHKLIIPETADSITENETKYGGKTTKLGLLISPDIHLRLSYACSFKYKLDSEGSENLFYPQSHSFGFFYQPPSRIPTKFVAEVMYEKWDEPILIYKFGFEHSILRHWDLRYGFCTFPNYCQTSIWTTVLTLGFGRKTERYYFDLGFGYGKRDYLSSEFGGLGCEQNFNFDECLGHFLLSGGISL